MTTRIAKRIAVAVLLCAIGLVGLARIHTPVAMASGCDTAHYQFCAQLWLNPGQMYSLDGYIFPADPQNDAGCRATGAPDFCWAVRSQTNTTWNATQLYTEAVSYDTCGGGDPWHEHQTSSAYGSGKAVYGSDAYGLYDDCKETDHHTYALDTYHYEHTNPDPNYY